MLTETLLRPARELVDAMVAKELRAVDVLALCKQRIDQVNPDLNALVVDRWTEAEAEAVRADEMLSAGKILGPLHGLPISIKEMFDVRGLPTTAGILKRRSSCATRDAEVVRRLRAAGAIVIGKGNVPQMGMMVETDNPVYGRTNNPWDLRRGPGGSSGGEAALVAAGAVPLALGSDGGGSIRQPAHACGICGFKPTGGHLPMRGHWLSANWPADWAQPGPLAQHVDSLRLAFSVLKCPTDRLPVYGEARPATAERSDDPSLQGLRVGVYEQFDEIPAAPTAVRAVRAAADALSDASIEVVPFRPDGVQQIWELYMQVFYAEGLRDMKRQLSGSPVDARIRRYLDLARLPRWVRPVAAWAFDRVGQRHIAQTLCTVQRPVLHADTYSQLLQLIQATRIRAERSWARAKIDFLIGPASPVPAFPHGEFYANSTLIYTAVYNLLGLPAGVVSATRVREGEITDRTRPRDVVDQAVWRCQQGSTGLPFGVQVIGRWWDDDRVLKIMEVIESRLKSSPDHPCQRRITDRSAAPQKESPSYG